MKDKILEFILDTITAILFVLVICVFVIWKYDITIEALDNYIEQGIMREPDLK